MNELQLYIFEQGLEELSLCEAEHQHLRTIGMTLAGHPKVLRSCYIAFLKGESKCRYKPLIGAPLLFSFHYHQEEVEIERIETSYRVSFSVFIRFFALVDLAFSKIYPLGTIVELDKELLPTELVEQFASEEMDFYAVLSGRRLQLDSQSYIDYAGHVYPYGMRFDTLPLYISNLFIKRVISEGYSDAKDSQHCDKELREFYFKGSVYSTIYDVEVANED
ncbi:DUF4176 domain-containing protein [Streptococcus cristatus]|jgi:hypothetical protein|uniref:DUF4176 domain-containing protein n=1 Tax=Streptococcus cristatus TaxID=45634 RepID=A0A428ALY1_STRCR|nr:DUF4176 domain-containing protein [Streptococcus cristatus]RSI43717.1 hypothetical protein D8872_04810 [Streptococcus cristatus]